MQIFLADNLKNRFVPDGIALGGDGPEPPVKRDEDGVPVEWRIFAVGDNPAVKSGVPANIRLDADDVAAIVEYFDAKGEEIPIDSHHYLHRLAEARKLSESEVLSVLPRGAAAMGFGKLSKRDDGLYLTVSKWNPTARELLKEGVFKYFSPVIRGLNHGPLRVTSVALENEPSLNRLDSLAASAEDDEDLTKGVPMDKTTQAIAGLLGRDSVELAAEDGDAEIAAAIDSKSALLKNLREALKLAPDVSDAEISAAVKGALEKAGGADHLAAELQKLKDQIEQDKHARLVKQGLADGKLTSDTAENWADTLDSAALAAYLEHAPVVIPVRQLADAPKPEADALILSAEDRAAIKALNLDEKEYLQLKKKGFMYE